MKESQENLTLVFPEQLNIPAVSPLKSEASQPVAESLAASNPNSCFANEIVDIFPTLGLLAIGGVIAYKMKNSRSSFFRDR